ncbi:MAG: hypothetical protein OEM52_15205, partial [bacterium]|nr:hypothetical protein [bacterium]
MKRIIRILLAVTLFSFSSIPVIANTSLQDTTLAKSIAEQFWTLNWAQSVAIHGKYAFVANGWEGVRVFDVANAKKIKVVGSILSEKGYRLSYQRVFSNKVVVSGNNAYICQLDYGISVYDIKNPKLPKLLAHLNSKGQVFDLVVRSKYAFLASGTAGIEAVDISDRTNPRKLDSLLLPGDVRAIKAQGDYA